MTDPWDYKASHSETEQFAACERRHYYSYGLQITGKGTSDALALGIAGHEGLATYYLALQEGTPEDDAVDLALEAAWVELRKYEVFDPDKLKLKLGLLLGHYFDHYANEQIKVLEVEVIQTIQLTQEFAMPVKLDLIAELPHYGVTLIDHKFSHDFFDVDKADLSPQLPRYYATLQARGIHVDTIMYNQLRTRDTKDNNADPGLKFERTPVYLNGARLARTMREQIQIAKRISFLKKLPLEEWEGQIVRNSMHCQMCPFKDLCAEDLNGGDDSQIIVEAYYEPRIRPTS